MGKKDQIVKKQKTEEKKSKKVVVESSDDDSSSEEVQIVAKKSNKTQAKAAKKAVKKVESSDDSSSEEETPVVKKSKKVTKKAVVESSDDSSSEEEVAPKKAVKKAVKKVESSDDSSSEEEVAPKKAVKKAAKKVESSDDSSSEEEVAPKKASKKASKVESSDSDSEEEAKPKSKSASKKQSMEIEAPKAAVTLAQNNGKWECVVRGLSYDADENDIGNWFEGKSAPVEAVKLLRDRETQRSRGMAFVVFESMEGLVIAIEQSGSEHMGRTVYINNSADPRDAARPQQQIRNTPQQPAGESTTIFVGNLTYQATGDDLQTLFADCGAIQGTRIAMQDGKSRGFGHVDFESKDAVQNALKMIGQDFQGRPIKVDVANARPQGGSGGQRGGRGGGFGGGRGGRGGSSGEGVSLNYNDKAAKKGSIVAFQGAKKTL